MEEPREDSGTDVGSEVSGADSKEQDVSTDIREVETGQGLKKNEQVLYFDKAVHGWALFNKKGEQVSNTFTRCIDAEEAYRYAKAWVSSWVSVRIVRNDTETDDVS